MTMPEDILDLMAEVAELHAEEKALAAEFDAFLASRRDREMRLCIRGADLQRRLNALTKEPV
jgi:hypothetical protein